jgi:two-component system phosphate regulon sensor histidine kinase PhoR
MNLSLRARLFLAYLLVLGITLAAVALLAAREQRAWVVARAGAELERLSLVACEALDDEARVMPGDWPAIADSLAARTVCRVTLIAADGRVLGDSGVPSTRLESVENHAGRPEVRAALTGHVGRDLRRSGTLGIELMYVARPAAVGEVRVLRLAEPLAVIAALRGSLLRLSVIAALLALVLGALLVFAVTARHVNRIRDLEHVTGQLTADEQPHRARETPADELGRLGAALNRMSAERRARMALLERERDEREQILAHMSDGVALIDGQGRIVRCNQSLATLLAAPLPAAPGTPFREFVRAPELDELLQDARRQGRPAELDLRLWTPAPRLVNATAIPLGPGSDDALLLVLRDLSEIERSNRVRQDFVANVSHELRTPLTSLRGYAETLLEGGLEDVEHRAAFVRVIRDNAVRLEALVEDLLSLADLERPGARLRRETFDLRAMAERQVAVFRPRAEAQGLSLALDPGPALDVSADRPRLEQVLANLLDNALKYTERGSVAVRLEGDAAWAWCEVSDTGQGIPEDDLPRVFERFYRVDKARSRDKGGTGLGLSIVKHIMALHDGEVAVTSVVGEGSTFRIHFPRGPIGGVRTA